MKQLLAILCLLLACGTASAASKTTENVVWYRVHLGMGTGSTSVSPEVMQGFIAKEISPRFPDGFTVTPARGQWTSPDIGLIHERTVVVDIQCGDTEVCAKKIEEISEAYVKRFQKTKASIFVVRVPGVSTRLTY